MNVERIVPRFVVALFLTLSLLGLVPTQAARAEGTTVVSLTFDDGYTDMYTTGRDILTAHNMKATLYIATGLLEKPGYMSWSQLVELAGDGHEIGAHTVNHTDLRRLTGTELEYQVCGPRTDLLKYGITPVSFAYPNGTTNDTVKPVVAGCGYTSGRGVKPGPEPFPPTNLYNLRVAPTIRTSTSVADLQKYVTDTEAQGGGWLIMVFHHVCDKCRGSYTYSPEKLDAFLDWLEPRATTHNTVVRTVGQVVEGLPLPPALP